MTTLNELTASFKRGFWLDDPLFPRNQTPPFKPTDDELTKIEEATHRFLTDNKRGRAINYLALGLALGRDHFLNGIRRRGILRPSKYGFCGSPIEAVSAKILEYHATIHLTESSLGYFKSIFSLAQISKDVQEKYQRLLKFLRTDHRHALKSFLVMVDYAFMRDRCPDVSATGDHLDFYTNEDIAEGLSFIFHCFVKSNGQISHKDIGILDVHGIVSQKYTPYLIDACLIRKFCEWEIFLDVLNYSVESMASGNGFTLTPPNIRLAQSLDLGYIQTEMQARLHIQDHEMPDAPSIQNFGEEFYKRCGMRFIERVKEPIDRFCYKLPLAEEMNAIFSDAGQFFKEEVLHLTAAEKEYFTSGTKILDFRVFKDLTLHDLVKIQRIICFLRAYVSSHLSEYVDSHIEIVLQSLIPRFGLSDLQKLLSVAVPEDKISLAIELLAWRPESERVFDIQYQPLLCFNDVLTVPMNVFSSSNIIRNSLQLRQRRVTETPDEDPVSSILAEALKENGWPVRAKKKYKFRDVAGEIDVIAIRGTKLFVFECKKSLHPCNIHEIRTSFDHIRKASQQLDAFLKLWAVPGFREYLGELLDWSIPSDSLIVTCIVTGNRMFTGYKTNSHAIRSIYELTTFMNSGEISLGSQTRRLWRGQTLTEDDLYDYIVNDLIHKLLFDSLICRKEVYPLGKFTIDRQVYSLNPIDVGRHLGLDVASESAEDRP